MKKEKMLFLTHYFYPHIGGVERHCHEVANNLELKGYKVKIITEKYNSDLKEREDVDGLEVIRFSYPHIKFLGLLFIWHWVIKNKSLFLNSDIVHIHDVFIWYLPLRFLYPKKKVFLTIHGLEWANPFNKLSLFQKRIAVALSTGSIGIGKFLEKYIKTKFDLVIYGGLYKVKKDKKTPKTITFVGRLEKDTGLTSFLKWLTKHKSYKVEFVGDGSLRKECEKYGKVHGFCDPTPFYKKSETIVPSGYLTFLEAKSYGCKMKTFYSTKLKKEYWEEVLKLKTFPTWSQVADEYLSLYNNTK